MDTTSPKRAVIKDSDRNSALFDAFIQKRINGTIRRIVFKYKQKIRLLKQRITEMSILNTDPRKPDSVQEQELIDQSPEQDLQLFYHHQELNPESDLERDPKSDPEQYIENPEQDIDNPEQDIENSEQDIENSEQDIDNPEQDSDNPEQEIENPELDIDNPEQDIENPEQETDYSEQQDPELDMNFPEQVTDHPEQQDSKQDIDYEQRKPDKSIKHRSFTLPKNPNSINSNSINEFYKSLDLKPIIILFFDTASQGITALSKNFNLDFIKQLIISIRNKIDNSRKPIHEKWLKSRIRKKLPPNGKKPFLKLFHYLNHFNLYYHHFIVCNKTKIPERPLDQKLKGIYEDVKTYSKFIR